MAIIDLPNRSWLSFQALISASFLLLLVVAPAASAACAQASSGDDLQWLHADGPSIVREDGAIMLLRGTNIPLLVRPNLTPVGDGTYLDVAKSMGYNVIRLPVSWAQLEPSSGRFSSTYLESIKSFVDLAAERRMYVVVDMHQFRMAGFPTWVLPKFKSSEQAAAEFWHNPAGQLELAKAWVTLASLLKEESTVAGYDLLNEPYGGTMMWQDFAPVLNEFYSRIIVEIRNVDAKHIIFFEPTEGVCILGQHIALKVLGMNVAFSPHFYVSGPTDYLSNIVQQLYNLAVGTWHIPLWIGEFGGLRVDVTNADSLHSLAVTLDLFDQYALGWAFCGLAVTNTGPRLIDGNGRTSASLTGIMTRIFPTSYTTSNVAFMYNSTHRFSLNASANPAGRIEVWMPTVSQSMISRCINCVSTKDDDQHSMAIDILSNKTAYFYLDSPENLALLEERAKSELKQALQISDELEATTFHSQLGRKDVGEIRDIVDSMEGDLTARHYEFVSQKLDRVKQLHALASQEEYSYTFAEAFIDSVSQDTLGSQGYLSKPQLDLLSQAYKSLDQGNYNSAIELAKGAKDLPREATPKETDPRLTSTLWTSSLVLLAIVAVFVLLRATWCQQSRLRLGHGRPVREV